MWEKKSCFTWFQSVDLSHAILFWFEITKTGALRASFRSAVTNEVRVSYQSRTRDPLKAVSDKVRLPPKLRGANENPVRDPSRWVVEKALWCQYSSRFPFSLLLGWICVLKSGKETSDLAEYFTYFKTRIGPKLKKMASDYFSAFLLTAKQERSSATKTGVPTSFHKLWCGTNRKRDFFSHNQWLCARNLPAFLL